MCDVTAERFSEATIRRQHRGPLCSARWGEEIRDAALEGAIVGSRRVALVPHFSMTRGYRHAALAKLGPVRGDRLGRQIALGHARSNHKVRRAAVTIRPRIIGILSIFSISDYDPRANCRTRVDGEVYRCESPRNYRNILVINNPWSLLARRPDYDSRL